MTDKVLRKIRLQISKKGIHVHGSTNGKQTIKEIR